METLVVVGAGIAGAHAAVAARRGGFDGRIILVGDEPSEPYDRPPLSKAYLLSEEETRLSVFFAPSVYQRERIELVLGVPIERLDLGTARVELAFGGSIPFDKLILATGSTARRPPVPGGENILTLRRHADALQIRDVLEAGVPVACIGAGVIGLEIAAAARLRGCDVTVVETGDRVMARSLPAEESRLVQDMHEAAGVAFAFGDHAVRLEANDLVLASGARIKAAAVIAGIGIERNLRLARDAGIETAGGIVVDAHGMTSAAGVFAAGEVVEYYSAREAAHVLNETWRFARDHGTRVGLNIAQESVAFDDVPWFWSDQHGANIQVAGSCVRPGRRVVRGSYGSDAFSVFYLDDSDRLVGAFGLNAGRDVAAGLRLIRDGHPLDATVLADTKLSPQSLVRAARADSANA